MWRKGTWHNASTPFLLYFVEENKIEAKPIIVLDYPQIQPNPWVANSTWEFGDFGSARKEIVDRTGIENYNWKFDLNTTTLYGVIFKEGKEIVTFGTTNSLEIFKWMDKEDLEKLSQNREPADAPNSLYQVREKGKFVWFSCPPGSGKSTTAQMLARKHGFVYYDADAFPIYCNPFVDLNADNPTLAAFRQKPLKVVIFFLCFVSCYFCVK